MNLNEQNSSASDEVAAAEAELRAAQETLKAARARLSELKGEHPAVEPGAASSDVVGDGEPVEAFGRIRRWGKKITNRQTKSVTS